MTSTETTGTATRRLPGSYTSRRKGQAAADALAARNPEHIYEVREAGRKVRSTYYVVCTTSPVYR